MAINLADYYLQENVSNNYTVGYDDGEILQAVGQSVKGNGQYLDSIEFLLTPGNTPTGNAYAKVYAHSGTFGTSSVPTGSALATSDAFDVTVLDIHEAYTLAKFEFTGTNRIELKNGTNYVITIEYYSDGHDLINTYCDTTSPTHEGNACEKWDGSWSAAAHDLIFYLYTSDITDNILSHLTVEKLTTTKEINGTWSAKMTCIPDSNIKYGAYVSIPLPYQLTLAPDDAKYEDYIVDTYKIVKSGGKYYQEVNLFHNMIELSFSSLEPFYKTLLVEDLLDYILDGSNWTAGTCDIDATVLLRADRPITRLAALNLLAEKCGGELDYHSTTRIVDLKRQIGTVTKRQIRYDKNLTEIKRNIDGPVITRVYCYGPDNYQINSTLLDNCDDYTKYAASGAGTLEAGTLYWQGSGSIKASSSTLNETFTRDLGAGNVIDLSGHDTLKFKIYVEADCVAGFQFGIGESAWNEQTVETGALTGGCMVDVELDLSGVADGDKDAIRHIGFKNLTDGAVIFTFDDIRAFYGLPYIDSDKIGDYKEPRCYDYFHSSRIEAVQNEIMIYPTDDSYISQGKPNTNYKTSVYLKIRDYGSVDFLSAIKWNLLNNIPIGATIDEAILGVTVEATDFTSGGSADIQLCDANWNENTLTYNNRPGSDGNVTTLDGNSKGLKEVTITSTVQNWWSGAASNFGLRFELNISDTNKTITLSSKEGNNPPYLKVKYSVTPNPSPIIEAGARKFLAENDEPIISYAGKFVDLARTMSDTWEDETVELGDTLRAYDDDMEINVDVRVRKITYDHFHPENTDIELVNKVYTLSDIQAKILRQLKYLYPFDDDDRVGYANTIQVGNLGSKVNV